MVTNLMNCVTSEIAPDISKLNYDSLMSLINKWSIIFEEPNGVNLDQATEECILKSINTGPDHVSMQLFKYAIGSKPPKNRSVERQFQKCVMGLINQVMMTMSNLKEFGMFTDVSVNGNNSTIGALYGITTDSEEMKSSQSAQWNQPSLTNLYKREPDFAILGKEHRVYLLGEIKKAKGSLAQAEDQLLTMAVPFDQISSIKDGVHHSFGAVFIGSECNLYYMYIKQSDGKLERIPL